jgi:1,4-dihydroxy-2-naphthoyl-CoA hydrolase
VHRQRRAARRDRHGTGGLIGAVCAFLNLPEGAGGTATIESKTNFFAATRSGTVKAHSHPLHIGKRVIVVETEIRGEDGKLAAKTIQSQAVL